MGENEQMIVYMFFSGFVHTDCITSFRWGATAKKQQQKKTFTFGGACIESKYWFCRATYCNRLALHQKIPNFYDMWRRQIFTYFSAKPMKFTVYLTKANFSFLWINYYSTHKARIPIYIAFLRLFDFSGWLITPINSWNKIENYNRSHRKQW